MSQSHIISHLMQVQHQHSIQQRLQEITEQLHRDILEFGSETEDNIACTKHIEYGAIKQKRTGRVSEYGIKIRGKNLLVSDVLNTAEGSDIPPQVKEFIPSITQEDWDSSLRIATLILISLEISYDQE